MKISRANYEAWFLDAKEGTLSSEEKKELLAFLQENPDLDEEYRSLEQVYALAEQVTFRGKSSLKKNFPPLGSAINRLNFGLFAIAYIEDDLDPVQRKAFEKELAASSSFQQELERYRKTRLIPEDLVYKGKDGLKKKPARTRKFYGLTWYAAAAAVLLALFLITNEPASQPEILSENDKEVPENTRKENKSLPEKAKINPLIIINQQKEQPADHKVPVKGLADLVEASENEVVTTDDPEQNSFKLNTAHFATNILPEMKPSFDQIKVISTPAFTGSARNASLPLVAKMEIEGIRQSLGKAEDLTLWDLASAGLNGINKLAGTDMSLMASRDDDGDLSGIRFSSRVFSVSTPVGRNKE